MPVYFVFTLTVPPKLFETTDLPKPITEREGRLVRQTDEFSVSETASITKLTNKGRFSSKRCDLAVQSKSVAFVMWCVP